MQPREPRYARKLWLGFAAVVFAFTLATLYVNWRTLEIGAETRNVAFNALPSLDRLTEARSALRRIELLATAYPQDSTEQRAAAREAIEARWRDVDRELDAYRALPSFPGERELYADVPPSLRASDEEVHRFVDHVDSASGASDLSASVGAVHERIDVAGAALKRVAEFNDARALESTERIEMLREHSATAALVLDGLSVALAIAATLWLSGVFRDHERLLRRHGELEEQRAAELESFGKRVAHDLLSPLSSLTYCLTAFRRAADADPPLAQAMVRATACVYRARTMVDGIFEFARSGGKPEPSASAPLGEVVDQVAEEIRATDQATRPEVIVEPLPPVSLACNRGVLTSILSNLMRNAQKYMADSPVRRIVVRAREEDRGVYVEVEDSGPGVAPEIREAIFEPYVRADGATQPGLGLGLATVRRLCDAHGGEVGVRSALGQGATFWFRLPRAEVESQAAPAPTSATKIRHAG